MVTTRDVFISGPDRRGGMVLVLFFRNDSGRISDGVWALHDTLASDRLILLEYKGWQCKLNAYLFFVNVIDCRQQYCSAFLIDVVWIHTDYQLLIIFSPFSFK